MCARRSHPLRLCRQARQVQTFVKKPKESPRLEADLHAAGSLARVLSVLRVHDDPESPRARRAHARATRALLGRPEDEKPDVVPHLLCSQHFGRRTAAGGRGPGLDVAAVEAAAELSLPRLVCQDRQAGELCGGLGGNAARGREGGAARAQRDWRAERAVLGVEGEETEGWVREDLRREGAVARAKRGGANLASGFGFGPACLCGLTAAADAALTDGGGMWGATECQAISGRGPLRRQPEQTSVRERPRAVAPPRR